MANVTKTFNISDVILTFGVFQITGFFDDIIKVSFDDAPIKTHEGCDGEVCRAINNKRLATATLQLIQSSASNDYLSASHIADRASSVPLPFILKDNSGTSVVESSYAYVEKMSDIDFGQEVKVREWVIKLPNCIMTTGGNNS
jgi:hypothetical protein